MSSKVYDLATSLTNRPDLKQETVTGIGLAISYYHSLSDWEQDSRTVQVTAKYDSESQMNKVDLSKVKPAIARITCLSKGGKDLNKVTCALKDLGTYVRSGNSLNFLGGSSCGHNEVVNMTYQSIPDVQLVGCCDLQGSWIADNHPEIVARYAAGYVKSILEDRSMRPIKMDEETLLRLYLEE